jgi:hypothetical protein
MPQRNNKFDRRVAHLAGLTNPEGTAVSPRVVLLPDCAGRDCFVGQRRSIAAKPRPANSPSLVAWPLNRRPGLFATSGSRSALRSISDKHGHDRIAERRNGPAM